MLGDRAAAEDVVQDAFLGLYRHWAGLNDPGNAVTYVRSAVLNGCRNALRQRGQARAPGPSWPPAWPSESAEAAALISEEHQRVLAAIRRCPTGSARPSCCRFYLDLSEEETARAMGVSRGTVKSATSRAVAALGRKLKEELVTTHRGPGPGGHAGHRGHRARRAAAPARARRPGCRGRRR